MKRLLPLLVLASCGSPPAPRGVGPGLERIRAKFGVPALAACRIEDGVVTVAGAAGADFGDRFHLGSCTKAMTATMIATLVEEGKLSWSTTVGATFGDVEMDAAWRRVTLEQLLTHRAGAPGDLAAQKALWTRLWRRRGTPREQRMELVRGVLARPPEVSPGTRYVYSNAGYAIAGAMAERVTDTAWERLMRERLFEPLGMRSAGFGPPPGNGPVGHREDGTPVGRGIGADNPPAIGPAGTVHASLGDWAKFVAFHLGQGPPLLRPETRDRLHRPEGKYALGWVVTTRRWAGGTVLTHSGSNTMWYCVAWLAPRRGFAVLAAVNQGGDRGFGACDAAAAMLVREPGG